MTDATYLVFLATGRQGGATLKALQANGVKNIVATSRNPESGGSKKLLESNEAVKRVLKADLSNPETVVAAIKESKASRIWFTTDWYAISRPTREKEFNLGKAVVDAIKKCEDQVDHVVYSSVGDADNCPETVEHFWSKADVEKYMEEELDSSKTTWAVIRPVAFFDNLDDAKNYNPLKKGVVKFLAKPDCSTKFIGTEDIGKGSAELLLKPKDYAGRKIEAAGGQHTGPELAKALTEASGTECTYKVALPRFVLWLFMRDLYHMVNWFESDGYTADIDAFKKVVPDAMDARAWFEAKGQWANGEKFAASKE